MRACIQRVSDAKVTIGGKVAGSCGQGFVVLLGVGPQDTSELAQLLWSKIFGLRVFDDGEGKMNLSLGQVDGEVLVISQFTLYADCRRGRRPSFVDAAGPELGNELYERFCNLAEKDVRHVGRGRFGADMQVSLTNDGPVTIWLDTDELTRPRHQSS